MSNSSFLPLGRVPAELKARFGINFSYQQLYRRAKAGKLPGVVCIDGRHNARIAKLGEIAAALAPAGDPPNAA
jgi:hypothetical protein